MSWCRTAWGSTAAQIITALIVVAAIGSVFAGLLGGSRVPFEAARDKVRTEAAEILKPYGARVDSIKGDPRGHTLLLVLPGQTNRGFGGNL